MRRIIAATVGFFFCMLEGASAFIPSYIRTSPRSYSSSSHSHHECTCGHRRRRPSGASSNAHSDTKLQALMAGDFDMIHVAGDVVAGFAGGAVGVVGTMLALEVKMRQVNERSKCPYCSGSGQLSCARCYGKATVSFQTAEGKIEEQACPSCYGSGMVTCINCKGDGLAIPVMLDKKASRDPETRLEEYGMG